MFELSKGRNLIINRNFSSDHIRSIDSIFGFLQDEYSYIFLNFGEIDFKMTSFTRSIIVNEQNYIKTIDENSFRLDGMVLYLPSNLKDYKSFFKEIINTDKTIFLIVEEKILNEVLSKNDRIFNRIFKIDINPEWMASISRMSNSLSQGGSTKWESAGIDRFMYTDVSTGDSFTLESYKTSYIRDKKIDIFLDNNSLDP